MAATPMVRGAASAPALATALEGIPPYANIQVSFSSLRHIDHACVNLLQSWQKLHEAGGGQVLLDWDKLNGLSYQVRKRPRSLESHHSRYPVSSWMDRGTPNK